MKIAGPISQYLHGHLHVLRGNVPRRFHRGPRWRHGLAGPPHRRQQQDRRRDRAPGSGRSTHHPPTDPVEDVTFLTDLQSAIDASAQAAGDRYVSTLGADVAAQCLAAGVLDEVLVTIVPTMLGDGVPLFRTTGPAVALDVIDVVYEPPSTTIWSRVIRP